MLTQSLNDMMCRTGPETPMGRVMRAGWLPALTSDRLPHPDCDPVAVDLLGEHFVAFRDTQGRVGVFDEHCCHRGASLLLGRVEACGIRCIYHGWKFAVDGTVLETPNVADPKFRGRFRAPAHVVREAGGLIWVFLGSPAAAPAFPDYPWLAYPPANRSVVVHFQDCNWVQVLEGLVDSSHLNILHANGLRASDGSTLNFAEKVGSMRQDDSPRIEVEDTNFGFHYAALRDMTTGDRTATLARVTAYIAPFTVLNPNGDIATLVVPSSDTRCAFYHVFFDADRDVGLEPLRSAQLRFIGLDPATADAYRISPATSDAGDKPARANRYRQDRGSLSGSFSGLPGLIEEDVAVSVSAGPMRDRAKSVLSGADLAIGRLHRTLLRLCRSVETGAESAHSSVAAVAGAHGELGNQEDWRSLVPSHRRANAGEGVV